MADPGEASTGEIQVSPEEVRFLRGFFRRHALPYLLLGAVALAAALALVAGRDVPQPGPGAPRESAAPVDTAALQELRAESVRLRGELAELRRWFEAEMARPVARGVTAVERRVGAALERLEKLEARVPKAVPLEPLASGDASAIVARLYQLEQRLAERDRVRTDAEQSILGRLMSLEERVPGGGDTADASDEGEAQPPAAQW